MQVKCTDGSVLSVCFVPVIKARQATATLRGIRALDNPPIMKNIRKYREKKSVKSSDECILYTSTVIDNSQFHSYVKCSFKNALNM